MSKGVRHYTFTLNNWDSKPELVAKLEALPCRYMVYGKEVGESGTPHLQGHVWFKDQKSHSAARKVLDGCHVEPSVCPTKSIEYCKKDGDFTERGTPPKSKEEQGARGAEATQEYWKNIRIAAEEGRYDDIPEQIRFSQDQCIDRHRQRGLNKRKLEDTEEKHQWYCGPSGTGKSRKAREENPGAYLKSCNKWWDGYEDHEVVLIEDFDKKHDVLCHHMKIWGDRYPFHAEVKGSGTGNIRPKKIIVTSNYHPKDIWVEDADLEPILRRFHVTTFGDYQPQASKKFKTPGLEAFANKSMWD